MVAIIREIWQQWCDVRRGTAWTPPVRTLGPGEVSLRIWYLRCSQTRLAKNLYFQVLCQQNVSTQFFSKKSQIKSKIALFYK